jgi:iron complex outermembrane recepter protein
MTALKAKLLMGLAGAVLASGGAKAQEAAHGPRVQLADASADAGDGAQAQGDIIVTAQKRDERLRDVPQGITVLTGEALARIGAKQMKDYVDFVPGLTEVAIGGKKNLVIRGLADGNDLGASVAVYVDDVPVTSASGFANGVRHTFDAAPFDIDRIEVLKGPQGTLYGAGAVGGLIKYVTQRPDLEKANGGVFSEISSTDMGGFNYDISAAASMPIVTDRIAIRVSGFQSHNGGYIDNIVPAFAKNNYNTSDTYGGRVDLLAKITDRLDIRVDAYLQDIRQGGLSVTTTDPAGKPLFGSLYKTKAFGKDGFNQTFRWYNGTLNYDFGFAKLTSVTSWDHVVSNETYTYDPSTPFPISLRADSGLDVGPVALDIGGDVKKFTQEVRLTSQGTTKLEWMIGGFYTNEDGISSSHIRLFDSNGASLPDHYPASAGPSNYKEKAAFAHVTYHLTDRLAMSGGIRYANSKTKASSGDENVAQTFNKVTYLADLQYKVSDDISTYARFATGARPGGPNFSVIVPSSGAVFHPPAYQPDSVKSYELGMKGETADKRLGFDLAVYQMNWDNIQVVHTDQFLLSYNANIPSGATLRGVELSASARPVSALSAAITFAYQDPRINADAIDLGFKKGDRLPNVPEFQGTAMLDYTFDIAGLHPTLGATLHYVDDRMSEGYKVTGYTYVDLRAELELGRTRFQAFIRNVNNSHGLVANNGVGQATPLQPRTIGINASTRF